MSTNEQPRTASGRQTEPATGPEADARSPLRADLEAVWAISASDGPGAGVDAEKLPPNVWVTPGTAPTVLMASLPSLRKSCW